jgi:hypothetical protein
MYLRGLSANKGEGIITIGARGEIFGEQKLEKIFLMFLMIAWMSYLGHVEKPTETIVNSAQR